MTELIVRVSRAELVDRAAAQLSRVPIHASHVDRARAIVELLSDPTLRGLVATALLGLSSAEMSALRLVASRIEIDSAERRPLSISLTDALAAREALERIATPR